MNHRADPSRQVVATVQEVLPQLGLAYVMDRDERCWGITRSTTGAPLERLQAGTQVQLTIEQYQDFAVASAWSPLD
jgi:hypothetical protein